MSNVCFLRPVLSTACQINNECYNGDLEVLRLTLSSIKIELQTFCPQKIALKTSMKFKSYKMFEFHVKS